MNIFIDVLIFTGAISTADGSALVKLGETIVICGVKAELTVPTAEEPSNGMIGILPLALKPEFISHLYTEKYTDLQKNFFCTSQIYLFMTKQG